MRSLLRQLLSTRLHTHLPLINIFICLSIALTVCSAEMSRSELDAFYRGQEQKFRQEYRECTGDTSEVKMGQIINWKKMYHERSQSPEYLNLLKQYMAHTGKIKDISPCEVFKWQTENISMIEKQERSIQGRLIARSDTIADSIHALNELKKNKRSKFDFDEIPFGISIDAFRYLFFKKFKIQPEYEYPFLYVREFTIQGTLFLVAFYFDDDRRFFKYEIEGPGYSGGLMDEIVRPQLKLLTERLKSTAGKPQSMNRISAIDINQGKLAVYAQWIDEQHTAYVGIAVFNNIYYSKAIVTKKQPRKDLAATADIQSGKKSPDMPDKEGAVQEIKILHKNQIKLEN